MNTLLIEGWQAIGQTPAPTLFEARLQLHWAAQIAASVGYSLVEPTPDWSHTSLDWLDDLGALASQPTGGASSFRAALRLADMTLLFLDKSHTIQDALSLDGQTLDEGYNWLTANVAAATGKTPDLQRPGDGLPDHPVAHGAAFSLAPPHAFSELSRWYANANRLLSAVCARYPDGPTVHTWPHHFDMVVLFKFDPHKEEDTARSLGVGLVPGDESYAEPYWYITPYPVADTSALPPLDGEGSWRPEGWFGAVLTATKIAEAGDAVAQGERTAAFIHSGIAASRSLLGLSS